MGVPLELTVQGTPNPHAAKFTLNRVVAAQSATYREAASASAAWAKELLGIAGVTQVFALNNFITVNKASEATWDVIGPQIEAVLRRAFA
ncbi:MAG: NifU N-terminal domain-containing protein [Candidatus Omnitrophica bacterium]|nr:NifU N-terminal domain-containing protein [Candidatus Omnitrophota bacterium]